MEIHSDLSAGSRSCVCPFSSDVPQQQYVPIYSWRFIQQHYSGFSARSRSGKGSFQLEAEELAVEYKTPLARSLLDTGYGNFFYDP